ncbi:TPA: hypothetical protein U1D21_001456 [Streptococcus suis]|nr:hypothetical protein [Streptococcus suis]
MEKLAIVGTFYDGYYDLWEDFLELFEKNWPDCPYSLYIVNDEKDLQFSKNYNVKVFHSGKKAEYSQRVQTALSEIDAEYYLLLLEDFFIGEKLDKHVLDKIMEFVINNNLDYYRMQLGEFTTFNKKGKVEHISPNAEYTVSCQPSIWKKEFLKKCIGTDVYNAWVFEGIYTKAPKAHTEEFLKGCYVDYRNVLCLYHGALQGKFLNRTYDHFAKQGYSFRAKMPLMDKKAELKHSVKKFFKFTIPVSLQRIIKKNIRTNSVVEKYNSEINRLIKKMGLDRYEDCHEK